MNSGKSISQINKTLHLIVAENTVLRERLLNVERELSDLETALAAVTQHKDAVETQLTERNKQLQKEINERILADRRIHLLLDRLSRQRDDLEILVDTLMEHGDSVEAQWWKRICEAEELAVTDTLTGLPNRRSLDEHLEIHWRDAIRYHRPLSILMCDVDYFKRYNDRYGHQEGDVCLREVGKTIARSMRRSTDVTARYGGEEFAIVLPETPHCGAMICAQNILEQIRNMAIPHEEAPRGIITLSIGCATRIPIRGALVTELMVSADQLLYRAKQLGRDQVCGNAISYSS